MLGKEELGMNKHSKMQELSLAKILSKNETIDLSGISPKGKIAIIEYYEYLLKKTEENSQ